ncbi:MAG: hypothetical protein ACTTH0_04310 [Eubacteriales bacterium]
MKFILTTAVLLAAVMVLHKSIKKYAPVYYIGAFAIFFISAAGFEIMRTNTLLREIAMLFERGIVATSLFTIVMWATLFKNGTQIKIRLMSVRAEISIIACILTLVHNFFYGKNYIVWLFTDKERLTLPFVIATILTIVLDALMLPLMITSFKGVRKKMKAYNWKKLQRLAYPFYMLIYVHVMVLFVSIAFQMKRLEHYDLFTSYIIDAVIYTAVFLSYAILRISKAIKTK